MVKAGRTPTPLDACGDAVRWLRSLPPVTRTYGLLVLIVAILPSHMKYLHAANMALQWTRVLHDREVWRLFTNLLVVSRPSLVLLVHMLWLLFFMAPLEKERFGRDPGRLLVMLSIIGALLNVASLFHAMPFNGQPLILACVYVWSKLLPGKTFSYFGMGRIEAFYAPFYCMFINILLTRTLIPDVTAMAAGHAYHLVQQVYPAML